MTFGEKSLLAAPTRVLHITDHLRVGGLQNILVSVANSMAARGHVVFVAAHSDGRLWEAVSPSCKRIFAPRKPSGLAPKMAYIWWLRNAIRRERIKIVHAHQRGVALLAIIAGLGLGVRVVEHVHNTFIPVTSPRTSFRGHRLIACGPSIKQMLVIDYKRNPDKITCVNNAVPDRSTGLAVTLPGRNPDVVNLLAVGRLTEQKDPLKFVRLVHELSGLGSARALRATWVGAGELLEPAEALAAELGVKNIAFVGDQVDVVPWISSADVLVLTSRWEGLPLAILEAMSLSRGIIAPRVGNCSEAVHDGSNGILYDPDAPLFSVAKTISACLVPSTLEAWGVESRRMYLNQFTPKRMLDEIENVYQSALTKRQGKS